MSITDELREYANRFKNSHDAWSGIGDDLTAIADRIDAEHERQLGVLYRDMSDAEWVRLPVDADGVPIHIGDVMEWYDGETFKVVGIGDGVLFYVEDGHELADWTGASTKRHHQPDTWERIIADAVGCMGYEVERDDDLMDLVARCKALCERTKGGDAE